MGEHQEEDKKINKKLLVNMFLPLIFIVVICLGNLNNLFDFIKKSELAGATEASIKPEFKIATYFNGEYQKNYDKWYYSNFPLRNNITKVYSQIKYSIFNKSPNSNVVKGKEDVLFEKSYIEEYLGITPPVTEEYLVDLTNDIKTIEEICKQSGKEFYLFITPSKADFYSDYIPSNFLKVASVNGENDKETRNYNRFVKLLKENNVSSFDSSSYLMDIRSEIDAPIYPNTGIHWTFVSAAYSLQEFIKFINSSSKFNVKNYKIEDIQESNTPFHAEDTDIYNIMNVTYGNKDKVYSAPVLKAIEGSNMDTPKVFMEGGSFCWQLLQILQGQQSFSDIDFLYYQLFITHFKGGETTKTQVDGVVTKEILDKCLRDKDLVILEVNQENIANMGRGFPKVLRNYLEQYGFPQESIN